LTDIDALIRRIAAKDEAAFEELYDLTKLPVFSILLAIVKDKAVAEDLMQDTYMKMIDALPSFEGKSAFKTWLVSIARNKAFDYLRQQHKNPIIKEEVLAAIPDRATVSPLKTMECEWLLSTLTEEERQIVFLKAVDGLKHREIAKLLNRPLGTILWMYQTAIAKMKRADKEGSHA
jgi:RNA polymerase sigma-70 factor (ECF subfamily)